MARNTYIEGLNFQLPHPFRRDAERLKEKFHTDVVISQDGVVRWKSNGNVPPKDVLEFWQFIGYPLNFVRSNMAREADNDRFMEQYRQNQRPHTPEELSEMRNAFGKGATVVDVITGRRTKL